MYIIYILYIVSIVSIECAAIRNGDAAPFSRVDV